MRLMALIWAAAVIGSVVLGWSLGGLWRHWRETGRLTDRWADPEPLDPDGAEGPWWESVKAPELTAPVAHIHHGDSGPTGTSDTNDFTGDLTLGPCTECGGRPAWDPAAHHASCTWSAYGPQLPGRDSPDDTDWKATTGQLFYVRQLLAIEDFQRDVLEGWADRTMAPILATLAEL